MRLIVHSNRMVKTPLTRPTATLSPSDGEREGVRGICLILKAIWNKWAARLAFSAGLQRPVTAARYQVCLRESGLRLRIAFASDFHVGPFTAAETIRGACRLLEEAAPDVLLLGGDFVSSRRAALHELVAHLSRIPAKLGRFAVLGDHDKRCGAEPVRSALEAGGIRVLANEQICLPPPYEKVRIVGLDDLGSVEQLLFHRGDGVQIVFMHSPANLPLLKGHSFTVAFCGHTHGGQIALPWGRPIYVPGGSICRQFSGGRYDLNGGTDRIVIVSRGIGCSLLPVRLFAPSDIVICDLFPSAVNIQLNARPHPALSPSDGARETIATTLGRSLQSDAAAGGKRSPSPHRMGRGPG